MYKKMIQRGALVVVALLFVVPIAILAQQAAFSPTALKIFDSKSVRSNLVLKDSEGKVMTAPYVVIRNSPFTLEWAAEAKEGGEQTTQDIVCLNSWSAPTASRGTTLGSISSDRTFYMTCAGIGAGVNSARPVKTGTADLTVVSVELGGKVANQNTTATNDYFIVPMTVDVTVKNSGTAKTPPFKVKYTNGASTADLSTNPSITVVSVDGIAGGATSSLSPFPWLPNFRTEPWYYRICVDSTQAVIESGENGENNNCKDIGPYTFVSPR